MCGIAGIIHLENRGIDRERAVMESMLEVMRHRGPDDRGISLHGSHRQVILGQLRLAILDLSPKGHQPMGNRKGNTWITYNGEIYNYIEIRAELKHAGYEFSSETDTEVILHAYSHWGLDCFRRLNGMWAVAIWDEQKHQLVISRDRLGIKPIYWYKNRTHLVIASEIKALLVYMQQSGQSIEIDPRSVGTYLNSGLVDGLEETFFKGIRRFKPGHTMVIREGDNFNFKYESYWNLPETAMTLRENNLLGQGITQTKMLYDLIVDAVHKHTRSDVPVGVCLSGGIDSSAIAGITAGIIPKLKTFTSWYKEGGDYNEIQYAQKIIDKFELNSFQAETKGEKLLEKLADILWYLDEPTLAMGIYPQWHVMEAAAKEVTVVMDGQGGDELFAGYDHYIWYSLYSRHLQGNLRDYQETLDGYRENYGFDFAENLRRRVKQLVTGNAAAEVENHFPDFFSNHLYQELTCTRLPALLRYEDRLSMAFSIESRVPLLDYRLVEFVFSLPENQKIGPGWTKYIFRQALQDLLPPEITWRKDKKGFPTPLKTWAQGILKDEIKTLLSGPESTIKEILGTDFIKKFMAQWNQGKLSEWILWRFLSLETWNRTYLTRLARETQPPPNNSFEICRENMTAQLQETVAYKGGFFYYSPALVKKIKEKLQHKKVILAPAGQTTLDLAEILQNTCEIMGFYDKNQKEISGHHLVKGEELNDTGAEMIIITSLSYGDEIEKEIKPHASGIEIVKMKDLA